MLSTTVIVGDERNAGPSRRSFLESIGGGLLVLLALSESAGAQESGGTRRRHSGNEMPQDVAAWLHISSDGTITAFTGKTEVGQNIRTSLTQAVADELRTNPASVQLVMADTALTPWDFGTVGSRTTPGMAPQLRKMAATMREQLITLAAEQWHVDRSAAVAENGCILDHGAGCKASYADLAAKVDWVKIIAEGTQITPRSEWNCAGKALSKIGAEDFVTGRHKYTSDLKRPGMLYGRVLRPASFGAKLASVNTTAAQKMSGVSIVQQGDFVGVAAENEFLAEKALARITAKWNEQQQISSKELFPYLKANPEGTREGSSGAGGLNENRITPSGNKRVASTYQVAYIAHVPLEPRSALAEWKTDSSLTVWTGTQRPFGVRGELAETFQLPEENVRVIVPDTGSAYGGKHTGECAIEAARLARAVKRPVKIIWTREEEFTWAYFRPAGVIDVESEATPDGTIAFWKFENYNSGPSGLESPYASASSATRFYETKYPLRQGSYRGLAATANHFARESYIDELAAAVGMDPLAFRLKNLNVERVRAVLEAVADKFDWQKSRRLPGRGCGMACGMEKGSYFACMAEVSVSPNRQIRVERVAEAFECGAIVNPLHLQNQVEGAIMMGLGGALSEAIDFANGRILNPRLSQYSVPRFSDAPSIECLLVDRKDLPSAGAGETPIMGIAPAIANALFQATKVRIRSMPIVAAFESSTA